MVVSLDGGRVRVRRKKRGPKTKKGRNRFHTDGKAPKLRILYVVGDAGRPAQTWAPIIDGTLRGPEAVFALLLSYARQIGRAIRRVINLRIKGASIYWLPESVDAILLRRSFYKSGRWNCLQRMAMTPVGVSA